MTESAVLAGLECFPLAIPFRSAFRHASAERAETATVWVRARSAQRSAGDGEGCPREYVTGESVSGALAFVKGIGPELMAEVHGLEALKRWAAQHRPRINANPAAWCAVELALLDLFARARDISVEALLGLPELDGSFRYSAVLGDAAPDAFAALARRYLEQGFNDFKVKLSGDLERDRRNLRWLALHGPAGLRLRADANNLWPSAQSALAYLEALGVPLLAVEEPLAAGDFEGLARLADGLGIPVILDESCTRPEHILALSGSASGWIVNLRVSKMGGLLRSLEVVEAARAAGIALVVGAQVGETSVLTRAALPVARAARDLLLGQEGGFGTLLLARDVCDPPLMFGRAGLLEDAARRFAGRPGFGLDIRALDDLKS